MPNYISKGGKWVSAPNPNIKVVKVEEKVEEIKEETKEEVKEEVKVETVEDSETNSNPE